MENTVDLRLLMSAQSLLRVCSESGQSLVPAARLVQGKSSSWRALK